MFSVLYSPLFSADVFLFACYTHTFFFNDEAPTDIYTLSLHDALPIRDALVVRPSRVRRRDLALPLLDRRQDGDDQNRHGDDQPPGEEASIAFAAGRFGLADRRDDDDHRERDRGEA